MSVLTTLLIKIKDQEMKKLESVILGGSVKTGEDKQKAKILIDSIRMFLTDTFQKEKRFLLYATICVF